MATFSDIDDIFGLNPVDNDVIADVDNQAIKNSMKSLILTDYGERPFLPYIGSNIKEYLFDNYSPANTYAISRSIKEVISNFEPRVIIRYVDVIDDDINNKYNINIYYNIVTDPNVEQTLSFVL